MAQFLAIVFLRRLCLPGWQRVCATLLIFRAECSEITKLPRRLRFFPLRSAAYDGAIASRGGGFVEQCPTAHFSGMRPMRILYCQIWPTGAFIIPTHLAQALFLSRGFPQAS